MTGRGAGYCAGYAAPGFMNPGGRGMGMAWGRGGGFGLGLAWRRGRGRGFLGAPYSAPAYFGMPALSREDELEALQNQADWLKDQMEAIDQRIGELNKQKK